MITILLLILKIIGITVLSIIGLFLVILCLILFVPIRYYFYSDNYKKTNADMSVSWLLHMIHIKIEYEDELLYRVRLFGYIIYPKKKRTK